MRKFFLFVSFLFLGFVVLNASYLWMLSCIDWDFSKTKEASNFENQTFKVLVFGNSTALDGVNAEMLTNSVGKTYNFSLGGASLESNYIQFQEYLKRNEKPEKVLLFLSSCHINYNRLQEINPIIEYNYADSLKYALSEMPLFKFRWLFIENLKKLLSSNHRNAQIVNGQLRITKSIPDQSAENTSDCIMNYDGDGYQTIRVFATECKARGIEFLVFEMPCWKKYQNDCPDGVVKKSGESVRVYNLNRRELCDSILNPSTDWLSEDHLNFGGSIKVTEAIERILLTNQ